MRNSAALLPTKTSMNPRAPETATYYDPGQTALVVRNVDSGTLRVLTTFGDLGDRWAIGTEHEIHHDQTLRSLGWFKVVGVARFPGVAGGASVSGEVPGRALPHWVFK